jgi:hypothetical protein
MSMLAIWYLWSTLLADGDRVGVGHARHRDGAAPAAISACNADERPSASGIYERVPNVARR